MPIVSNFPTGGGSGSSGLALGAVSMSALLFLMARLISNGLILKILLFPILLWLLFLERF